MENKEKILEEKVEPSEDQLIKEKSQYRQQVAELKPRTDRDIHWYKKDLGIPITKEFLGENVLDLGSGDEEIFVKQAVERGIKVFPLNPQLNIQEHRDLLKESWKQQEKLGKETKKRSIAGLAQELPYKSNIFDSVLSMWAIPMHLPKKIEEYEIALREIVRVLKPGGKAFLAPVRLRTNVELSNRIVEKLEKEGSIEKEEITDAKSIESHTLVLVKPKSKK